MKGVELYGQVRRAVYVEWLSRREAARRFGIDPRTVAKMLAFSVPPEYPRGRPPGAPTTPAPWATVRPGLARRRFGYRPPLNTDKMMLLSVSVAGHVALRGRNHKRGGRSSTQLLRELIPFSAAPSEGDAAQFRPGPASR
jgi:hypothetical protein